MNKLVSVVIPTFNCDTIIKACLESVKKQTYTPIEIIVADSFSTDKTPAIAKKYGQVYSFGRDPKQVHIFGAPYQRNYAASKAKGEYVYWIDSDMRLTPGLIEACITALKTQNADAVIIPEVSYGESFWAECRALEKACYNKSPRSYTDTARFIKKSVWDTLGGLDPTLGGADDYDFQNRLDAGGYKTVKIKNHVMHYEGNMTLKKQLTKKFVYGKTALGYFKKYNHKKGYLNKQYLFRPDFLQQYDLLIKDPIHAVGMITMKFLEYSAGFSGLVYGQIKKEKIEVYEAKQ